MFSKFLQMKEIIMRTLREFSVTQRQAGWGESSVCHVRVMQCSSGKQVKNSVSYTYIFLLPGIKETRYPAF